MYWYILVHIYIQWYILLCRPVGSCHESASLTSWRGSIWHALRPGTAQTPTGHSQRLSMHHSQHAPAEYDCIGICWYMLVYLCVYMYIPACTVLSDTELSVSGYNMVQGGTMKYHKVILVYAGTCWYTPVYTGIYQHVQCSQTLKFPWNPLVDTSPYKAVHCSMRTVPKCPVPLNETVQDGTRQY